MIKKCTAWLLIFCLAVTGQIFFAPARNVSAAPPVTGIPGMAFSKEVATPPIIDGVLDDANWNPTTKLNNLIVGSYTDNTVTFDTAWDATNLYVAVNVLDADIVNNHHDSNLYEDDCVEVFLDGTNSKKTSYDDNDFQIFVRTDNAVIVKRSNSPVDLPGLVTAVSINSDGYSVELQIPWVSIGTTPKEGNCIGFDVGNDDNDSTDGVSGRDAALSWNATGNTNWGNPFTFGTLFLTCRQDPVISTEGTPVIDGDLSESEWHLDKSFTVPTTIVTSDDALDISYDNTVYFGSLCDQNYLYVGVKVLDTVLLHDSPYYYNDDSIELFLNPDNSKAGAYGPNDKHLVVAYGVDGIIDANGNSTAGMQAKCIDIPGGYSMEIAIPWLSLGITPMNLATIGFDIQNNDADLPGGDRQGCVVWNGDGNDWQDTSKFGSLIVYNDNIAKQDYTGPKATFTDDANTTDNVFEKSPSVRTEMRDFGDLGLLTKIMNGWADDQYVVYKSPSMDILSFQIETLEQDQGWLKIYASPDNINYTELEPGIQYGVTVLEPQGDPNNWFNLNQYNSDSLPAGTMYLKLAFTNSGDLGWKFYINNVSFDYKGEYAGPKGTFTDDAADLTKVYASYNIFQNNEQSWYAGANKLTNLSTNPDNGYVVYKSPSGDILSFTMDTCEMPGGDVHAPQPAFDLYVSGDNVTYKKVALDSVVAVNASPDTGWFDKVVYSVQNFNPGVQYLKIVFNTTDFDSWTASIMNVTFDYKKLNKPPTALRDLYKSVQLDTPVAGSVLGADADGDTLTYTIDTPPTHGNAVISDENQDLWSYTPDNGFVGFDTFRVKVDDGNGGVCFTKVVVNENYAPTNLDYYVDCVNGSDANNGLTPVGAFKSLQRAADLTKPGDTVHIMTGTYTDDPRNGMEAPLIINNWGLPDAYITYTADPGQHPVIHVSSQWNHILICASYIKVENLEVIGDTENVSIADAEATYTAMANGTAIYSDPAIIRTNTNGIIARPTDQNDPDSLTPNHIEIANCKVSKIAGGGISTNLCDYVTIKNNVVSECAVRSAYACSGISVGFCQDVDGNYTDYRNIVEGNLAYDNQTMVKWYISKDWSDGNGIIVDDNKNDQLTASCPYKATPYQGKTLVANNIAYENGGSGIHTYASSNVDIVNNTAYCNNVTPSENWGQIFAIAATNCNVVNNIMYGRGGINQVNQESSINVNVTYDHNIYYNGVDKVKTGDNITADPQFVDPANYDFHLKSTSPAIGAGVSWPDVTADFSGQPRSAEAGFDIGAYEAGIPQESTTENTSVTETSTTGTTTAETTTASTVSSEITSSSATTTGAAAASTTATEAATASTTTTEAATASTATTEAATAAATTTEATAAATTTTKAASIPIVPIPGGSAGYGTKPAAPPTVPLTTQTPAPVPMPATTFASLNDYRSAAANLADQLYTLGLFLGTGTDSSGAPTYELTRPLTRLEALSLVIRLMGLADAANNYTGADPFTDVPAWGDRTAAYAYSLGITSGVNTEHTLFASDRPVTYQEFTAFLLRVLGYSESNGDFVYDQALSKAIDAGLYTSQERMLIGSGAQYLRADAVISMTDALLANMKNSNTKLIDKLTSDGVLKQDAASNFKNNVSVLYTGER